MSATPIPPNLTITVDADVLRRVRMRALERGKAVSRFLAEQLGKFA